MSSFNPAALAEFARYYGFHYEICDPVVLIRDVLNEMERGLRGRPSDLPMIPAYISPVTRVTPGKQVIALDAGGTNLRAALVSFDGEGNPQAEGSRKAPMPGTKGQVSAEVFFDEIAGLVAPLIEAGKAIEGIGFCFSYPMEITKDSDGILMEFSKEVEAPEVIGRRIGAGLRDALARRKLKAPERIVLLNDTVATLLSGLVEIRADSGRGEGADRYGVESGPVIGVILGTGFNTAYPEKRIPKIGFESESAPQIVVCETGNFHPRFLGFPDREYDATTKNPGAYSQEKACAGAYLGPLTLHIFKQAIQEGLLRFRKSDELLALPGLQTKDLNVSMCSPLAAEGFFGQFFGLDERDALASAVYLASMVTKRAGLLSAAVVAAMVERMGAGCDPLVPVRIAVEGTTYLVYKGMREALESNLYTMLNAAAPRFYAISPVEQASLFGAAVAALSS
ncbi:MAG: hexokinase [Spirochaetaceae bacterium]|jgi:hexokinase|nr:hexokinase [Spirochaetaceae bacterium]